MLKTELQILLRPGSRYFRLVAEAPEEKNEAEKQEQEALWQKEEEQRQKEEALRQKEEAILKADESPIKLARQMKKNRASNKEIVRETG